MRAVTALLSPSTTEPEAAGLFSVLAVANRWTTQAPSAGLERRELKVSLTAHNFLSLFSVWKTLDIQPLDLAGAWELGGAHLPVTKVS